MSKPVIVAVDDDPQVLGAVRRDLRSKYAADYRIVSVGSGAEAISVVSDLKGRGDTVALFLVDQRMPGMEGTELLIETRALYPDARRVLLTAYADTEAAISAINEADLDHYLMKPWDPPDERLFPVLDDLLNDWWANNPPPYDGIRVIGTRWSPATYEIKDFLARNQVPYRFLDVERDAEAEVVMEAGAHEAIPVVLLPDGTSLVAPDRYTLAQQIGLQTEADSPFYDLIIAGGGPAGLAAAVYGASEGLRTVLIEQAAPGGQAGTSSRIENYLGFPSGISGGDLARRAVTQASRLGAEILSASVVDLRIEDGTKIVTLSTGVELRARAVLIATGMTVRRLAVPGYERFEGAGVYYGAAPSEAATYAGGEVYVVGGANSAGQAAMMFSKHAAKVTMVVRSDSLEAKMSQYLVDQIQAQDNIEVLLGTRVVEVLGEDRVERIRLENLLADEVSERAASAVFIFVGAVPHSAFLEGVVAHDSHGFIYTGPDLALATDSPHHWTEGRDPYPLETSEPGIFAAGDVRFGVVRRVASAVGQGSVAVSMIHQYLETV
jgi:thioredoxin reductase (NADPH)